MIPRPSAIILVAIWIYSDSHSWGSNYADYVGAAVAKMVVEEPEGQLTTPLNREETHNGDRPVALLKENWSDRKLVVRASTCKITHTKTRMLDEIAREEETWLFKQGKLSKSNNRKGVTYNVDELQRSTKGLAGKYDFSGVVVHRNADKWPGDPQRGGGALVTRQHIICARHTSPGGKVTFIDRNSVLRTYQIVNGNGEGWAVKEAIDCEIYKLDRPAHKDIAHYPLTVVNDEMLGKYVVFATGWGAASPRRITRVTDDGIGHEAVEPGGANNNFSGKPCFVPAEGQLLLIGTRRTVTSLPQYAKWINDVNSNVERLGGNAVDVVQFDVD